jgi:hypothetical protein
MVGDMVDEGEDDNEVGSYDFVDYINALKESKLPRHKVFHIAGNHEFNRNAVGTDELSSGLTEYDTWFPKRNYHTLQGNILTIFMSSENYTVGTAINNATFEWWEKLVRENQDKIIITVTHAPLYDTTSYSTNASFHIKDSERFIDVLDEAGINHDIWLHGHNAYNISQGFLDSVEKHGTWHMNVGLHIKTSIFEGWDVHSRFLYFTQGSTTCTVKMRNHVDGEWKDSKELTVTLNNKAEISNAPIFDGRYQFDSDNGVMRNGLTVMVEGKDPSGDGNLDEIQRPLVLTQNDQRNLNMQMEAGTGILFNIAGDGIGDDEVFTQQYGVGGAIDVVKGSTGGGNDAVFNADIVLKASGDGNDEASLIEVMRIAHTKKVGIGTTTPESELEIYKDSGDGNTQLHIHNDNTGNAAVLNLEGGRTADNDTAQVLFSNVGNTLSGIKGYRVGGNDGGDIRFFTSESGSGSAITERMKIAHDGKVTINGDVATLNVGSHVIRNGDSVVLDRDASGETLQVKRNSSAGQNVRFYNGTNIVGTISTTSSTTAYNTSSDYRLKEDLQEIENSIDILKALNPINFAWKVDGSRTNGFIAHELQAVIPEAATGVKDAMRTETHLLTPEVKDEDGNVVEEAVYETETVPDYQGIDQSKIVPILTKALQDAIARIEVLESKIAQG